MIMAIMKAKIQVTSRIPLQDPQPTIVWLFKCFELRKRRKNTKRAETEAYRQPRKMMVGIMNEKATFLYRSSNDPNAGAVTYWLPV
jgi:hypothetical protein